MVKIVDALSWKTTGNTMRDEYVASVGCDAAISDHWVIRVTTQTESMARPVVPRWLTVDNIDRPNYVTLTFGPVSLFVPPYKRSVFPLPIGTSVIELLVAQFVTNVWLSEEKICENEVNEFAVAQAANPNYPGMIGTFAMQQPPDGWYICNGAAYSRIADRPLFLAIGTTYGAGDGSSTFNVPNAVDCFFRMWGQGGGIAPARAFGSLQTDKFKSHAHSHNDGTHVHYDYGHIHVDSGHDHPAPLTGTYPAGGIANATNPFGGPVSVIGYAQIQTGYASLTNSYSNISINANGDDETAPRNLAVQFAIKR